jgi:hypothetical protein
VNGLPSSEAFHSLFLEKKGNTSVDKVTVGGSSQDDLDQFNAALTYILGAPTAAKEEIYPNPIFLPGYVSIVQFYRFL